MSLPGEVEESSAPPRIIFGGYHCQGTGAAIALLPSYVNVPVAIDDDTHVQLKFPLSLPIGS